MTRVGGKQIKIFVEYFVVCTSTSSSVLYCTPYYLYVLEYDTQVSCIVIIKSSARLELKKELGSGTWAISSRTYKERGQEHTRNLRCPEAQIDAIQYLKPSYQLKAKTSLYWYRLAVDDLSWPVSFVNSPTKRVR
jgi:hypothetical protein